MIDPITLTVLQNRIRQIAEEMDTILDRAAFSPIISEGRDRASGIYDVDGRLITQGITGMPVHIGAMQFGVSAVARKAQNCKPGDIYIINDPYLGGTHLMDVKVVLPIFVDSELFCWLGSSGHWPDIGGAVPGGYVTTATEVQQEGLRLGGLRLYREGTPDPDLLQLILDNVRVPEQRLGDLKAQVASLRAGEKEFHRIAAEFGAPLLREAISMLHHQSATLVREIIGHIKPGTYVFGDMMDNDGVDDIPLWIRLKLTVEKERLVFDFSDSSPPCRGPLNCVIASTASAVYIAFKHLFPDVPLNGGFFEPFEIIAPETTFLNAKYPRPVSGCAAEVSQRVVDVCLGAFAQALPERSTGAPVGTVLNLTIGGFDPVENRRYIFYLYTGGGHGGYAGGDGISNAPASTGLAKTPPIEIVEQHAPVLFEEYALRPDSAGAGEFRGGFGIRYALRLLSGEAYLAILGDRNRRGPFGILGGESGASAHVELSLAGTDYVPPMGSKDSNIYFQTGDRISVRTPGGGGRGETSARAAELVTKDRVRGYISHAYAVEHYPDQVAAGERSESSPKSVT
jgi:N-methylhydantoinase B